MDTHVERCAKRLCLAFQNDSPYEVEMKLEKIIPENRQILFHHQMIHFGRYHCLARNPNCAECALKKYCTLHKVKVEN